MIKIFGERNTSTNALKALIESNSESPVAPAVAKDIDPAFGQRLALAKKVGLPDSLSERLTDRVFHGRPAIEAWKHADTRFDDIQSLAGCHVIFCVRHPASWVLALMKRPYHIAGNPSETLAAFLDKRWRTVGRERMDRAETSAIDLYNAKIAAYAQLQAQLPSVGADWTIVRHEDFAIDQARVFDRLAPALKASSSAFKPLDASTKDPGKTRAHYQEYYGNKLWRDEIDAASMRRINEGIDWAMLEAYGYAPE